jgi:hypothetical protein
MQRSPDSIHRIEGGQGNGDKGMESGRSGHRSPNAGSSEPIPSRPESRAYPRPEFNHYVVLSSQGEMPLDSGRDGIAAADDAPLRSLSELRDFVENLVEKQKWSTKFTTKHLSREAPGERK